MTIQKLKVVLTAENSYLPNKCGKWHFSTLILQDFLNVLFKVKHFKFYRMWE